MNQRERAKWTIGRREVYAMIVGAALYAGLSWLTNVFHLQAAADLQIRPGVAVPILFGFVFGPVVGFVTGALGNFTVDLASGLLPYPPVQSTGNPPLDVLRSYLANWQIGNGLMGLIPGLAAIYYRRYFTWTDQLRALAFAVLGILLGIGFASFSHVYVDLQVDLSAALHSYFLPTARVNLLNAVVLVPLLLFNYERFDFRSTDWIRSGLMRRLLLAILISAALPVALLGLFLTQQSTGGSAGSTDLMVKLAGTIVITLVFTIANAGLVAQSMSRPLMRLINAAHLVQANELSREQASELEMTAATDEIGRLTRIFGRMAHEVIEREHKLRQEIHSLRIEIDETKKERQVAEITDTDYFRSLRGKARQLREEMSDP